jgi:hypothetical protein
MNQFVQDTETIPVQALSIGLSYADVTLRIGTTSVVTDASGVPVGAAPRWARQLSLSPTLAVQLHAMLGDAIAGWERQFGMIPRLALHHTVGGEARGPVQEPEKPTSARCPGCEATGWLSRGIFGSKRCEDCDGHGFLAVQAPSPGATLHSLEAERLKPRE